MLLFRFCLCCFCWSLVLAATGQGRVTVLADSTYLVIGDPVRCTLVVSVPKGASSVTAPLIGEVIAQSSEVLELLAQEAPLQENQTETNDVYQYPLQLTVWEPGQHELPPLEFSYVYQDQLQTIRSKAVTFTAIAPQVTGDSTYIADIKPILAEKPNFFDWLYRILTHPVFLVLLFLLLAIGAVVALVRYRNHLGEQADWLTPEEWALGRLAALRESSYLEYGNVIAFHTEVSYIIRRYLKLRYRVDALEQPNSVILPPLAHHLLMDDAALHQELTTVLEQADLIKYAKASPLSIANDKALILIRDLVAATQRRLDALRAERKHSSPSKTVQR